MSSLAGLARSHAPHVLAGQGGASSRAEPLEPRPSAAPRPTPTSALREGAGVRLVVADDDALVRGSLRQVLEASGFRVVAEGSDGAEAVDAVDRHLPEVVLLDQRMPVMDGIEATRVIRRHHPTIQVVMLSAHDDPGLQAAAAEAGAVTYLVKGCRSSEIREAITRAAELHRSLVAGGREGGLVSEGPSGRAGPCRP